MVADNGAIGARNLHAARAVRCVAVVANDRSPRGSRSAVVTDHNVGNDRLAVASAWIDDGKWLARPGVAATVMAVVAMIMVAVVAMVLVMTVVASVAMMMAVMMSMVSVMVVIVMTIMSKGRSGLPGQYR